MTRDTRRGLLALALAIVAVAAFADVALWVFAPVPDPYEQFEKLRPQINQYIRMEFPPDYAVTTITEEHLSGLAHENRFTTDNMGFRGPDLAMPKPPGEFRVFLVGGSTTECFYLDDDDQIGAVVQRLLNGADAGGDVRVYNVGLSGAASDDHVAMISQRLVHLDPDLIVVFAGINDLTRSIYNYDYLHYVEPKPAYRKPWYKHMFLTSQIARRLYFLRRRIDPSDRELLEERRLESNYEGKIGLQRTVPPSDTPPRVDAAAYRRNLETIAGMAHAHGFELVFMTQQTTWNSTVDPEAKRFHWMRYRGGITYREDLMDAAMKRLNDAMRAVAAQQGVPVYDLARDIPKSLEYFYDDCHFNIAGARRAGEGLARFIVERGLLGGGSGEE